MQKLVLDVFFGIPAEELIPMSKNAGFDGIFVGQDGGKLPGGSGATSPFVRR